MWEELERILDEWAELKSLMAEPSEGFNHGRVNHGGQWRPLDGAWDESTRDWVPVLPEDEDLVSFKHYPENERVPLPEQHGTYYAYARLGCRCDDCRRANADYHRQRRNTP